MRHFHNKKGHFPDKMGHFYNENEQLLELKGHFSEKRGHTDCCWGKVGGTCPLVPPFSTPLKDCLPFLSKSEHDNSEVTCD